MKPTLERAATSLAVVLAIACVDSGQTGAPREPSTSPPGGECTQVMCEAEAMSRLTHELGERIPASVVGSSCEGLIKRIDDGSVFDGIVCTCHTDDGKIRLGPAGVGCLVYGHGGSCLWSEDDVQTECSTESCEADCAELDERMVDDAAQTYDFVLRYTECVENVCEAVFSVGDSCYSLSGLSWHDAQDCALSDAMIIGHDDEGPPAQSTNACDDASDCTHAWGCDDGVCFACNATSQCLTGEVCVNGRCLLEAAAECVSSDDCSEDASCVLMGLEATDAGSEERGNEWLRAECVSDD